MLNRAQPGIFQEKPNRPPTEKLLKSGGIFRKVPVLFRKASFYGLIGCEGCFEAMCPLMHNVSIIIVREHSPNARQSTVLLPGLQET